MTTKKSTEPDLVAGKPKKSTERTPRQAAVPKETTPPKLAGMSFAIQHDMVTRKDFLDRIATASFNAAQIMYPPNTAANSDAKIQAQRLALINAVVNDPEKFAKNFAYMVVSRPQVVSEDVPDNLINTILTSPVAWDSLAVQLFPNVTP